MRGGAAEVSAETSQPRGEMRQSDDTRRMPLVVDMDGTVLRTDTLFESIADLLRLYPLWTLFQMLCLPFAIAKVKARIQSRADIDIPTLPINTDVLDYCEAERAKGREVWLVSAADQAMVEEVARHLGVFDKAIGSDGKRNNKGGAKARLLEETFPDGFEYIGDSPADMPIWRRAKRASVVGGGKSRTDAIRKSGVEIGKVFERPKRRLRAWRKAMRIHQWAKNALIFVAPLLAMDFADPTPLIACAIAFPLIGLLASGTYIFNDLLDLKADRAHHSKCKRPFADGQIKLWQGFVAAPLLIFTGLLGGVLLSVPFAITLVIYLVVTLAYSFYIKRFPLLDAATLGLLFTIRLIMGGALAGIALTQWLIVFSMFLFVSLSLAKRHVEIYRKAAAGHATVKSRGYRAEDQTITLGFGLATATATPIILVLYILESAWPSGAYSAPGALWAAPVILSLWLMRVWLLANRGELDDDPVVFAIKDPMSLILGALLVLAFGWAAFGPPTPSLMSLYSGGLASMVMGLS